MGIILIYSVMTPDTYGGIVWEFSFDAYRQYLFDRDMFDDTLTFNAAYLETFWRSIKLGTFSTVACLVLGLPTAYFIATRPPNLRALWVFMITLPFWTNLLIRTYCVLLILREEGLINNALRWL